ncbi:MAG: Ada metal-binding domain-containing protein [Planctomycetota bacterium]|jgi:hypothetical protein
MNLKKYYLILAPIAAIVCIPVLGEVGFPWPHDELMLLAQPNPALVGIDELHVFIVPHDTEPNKHASLWKELDSKIKAKFKEAEIKIARLHYIGYPVRAFNTPELKVNIDMLELEDYEKYVFRIETSLASRVFFANDASRFLKAEAWKVPATMQAVSAEEMPARLTETVMGQVEAFISCYQVANEKYAHPPDANDIGTVIPKELIKPLPRPAIPIYNCVASKNSKVFHRPGCGSAAKISPENLIGYGNRADAIEAGKRPCKRCKP